LAKIAVELERALARRAVNGTPGGLTSRVLAQGNGWIVEDVVCTSGPQDRSFEERHSQVSIALVVAGTFQYRASLRGPGARRELMTPGSLLLGNAGQCFECGHEHAAGDRCLSFRYAPDFFARLAFDAGVHGGKPHFDRLRLPPLRAFSPVVALACAGLTALMDSTATPAPAPAQLRVQEQTQAMWEELSLQIAAQTLQLLNGTRGATWRDAPPSAMARVTRTVRMIECDPDSGSGFGIGLGSLSRAAGLSPYHFLRTFERVTGVTPHQYVLRARLRQAAMRLAAEPARIVDIALDCGFGDVSNFNRAFRAEFGMSPRQFRFQKR
jgi:AraC family transcriptional regulator